MIYFLFIEEDCVLTLRLTRALGKLKRKLSYDKKTKCIRNITRRIFIEFPPFSGYCLFRDFYQVLIEVNPRTQYNSSSQCNRVHFNAYIEKSSFCPTERLGQLVRHCRFRHRI